MVMFLRLGILLALTGVLVGCNYTDTTVAQETEVSADINPVAGPNENQTLTVEKKDVQANAELETITLGAGCFWCIEAILDRVKGVESVVSGYMGGDIKNPTYEQVCTGRTGHAEVVQVVFDPKVISLDGLLHIFWQLHDPTTLNRQGADVGTQYRSAIFYHSPEQKETAEKSKAKWNASGKFNAPIVTEISAISEFYKAEDYHQEFFARNPGNPYCNYNIPPKLKKLGLLKDN